MKKLFLSPVVLALLGTMAGAAKVDLTRNSVKAGSGKLKAGAEVGAGSDIATGSKSKLQLSVGSKGGTYRAGSLTDAVLNSDQSLSLKKGIMLSSSGGSGSGFSRESLSIDTPEVRSTVKGTMLVAYQPDSYIKITCIEGRVSVKLKSAFGEFVDLKAGQMLILNPADKSLPESVEVDLKELAATSALLGKDFPPLGAEGYLATAADRQGRAVRGGDLRVTNLLLDGAGPGVAIEQGIEGQRGLQPPPPPPDKGGEKPPGGGGGDDNPPPVVPPVEPEPKLELDGYVINETTVFIPGGTGASPGGSGNDLIQAISLAEPNVTTPGFPTIFGTLVDNETTVFEFVDGVENPALVIVGTVDIPVSRPGAAYGTMFLADGLMQIGTGEKATTVTGHEDLAFNAEALEMQDAHLSSDYNFEFNANKSLLAESSVVFGDYVSFYAADTLTFDDTEAEAEQSLFLTSGGAIIVQNSTLRGLSSVQVGNGSPTSNGVITIGDSILESNGGTVEVYSNSPGADMDNILITNSKLTSGYTGSSSVPTIQIGNDDTSGGQFAGGIVLQDSELTAVGDIGVQTGVTSSANSGAITVDKSTLKSSAGSVNVVNKGSNGDRVGILVRNSSQLLALASTGSVRLTTNGSQIQVVDTTLTGGNYTGTAGASGGEVLIDAMAGASPTDTLVQLTNVTASADIIRARSYNSADRDALVINGGRFDAANALKFYAEGASKLRFTGNVALNTPQAVLAGKIVQVDSGGTVTVSGRGSVYADDHRYNNSSYGNIRTNGGQGEPSQGKFTERPGF